jgi:hypothetical protein
LRPVTIGKSRFRLQVTVASPAASLLAADFARLGEALRLIKEMGVPIQIGLSETTKAAARRARRG